MLFKPLCICFSFASTQKTGNSPSLVDVFSEVDIGCFLDLLAAAFVEFCFQPSRKMSPDLFIYLLQVLHNLMRFEDLSSIRNSITDNISANLATKIQDRFTFESSTNRADFFMSNLVGVLLSIFVS